MKIAPSILASDFSDLRTQIRLAEKGKADMLHLDVMDGHFVPNITFGPQFVAAIRSLSKLPLDVHLMIDHPDRFVQDFRRAGADLITVHQEACRDLQRCIAQIKEEGAQAGVALNPATPVRGLEDVIEEIDLLLIMSVNPGFGGQSFLPASVQKLRQARELIAKSGRTILLEVDGGIDPTTAPLAAEAGADVLVAGTSIFHQPDIPAAVERLRASATRPTEKNVGSRR